MKVKLILLSAVAISSLTLAGCNIGGGSEEYSPPMSQGWSQVGGNGNNSQNAYALTIDRKTNFLYSGGEAYESSYNVGVVNQWNGVSWSQVGNKIKSYASGGEYQLGTWITTLALNQSSGDLYAGGISWLGVCSLTGQYWSSCNLTFLSSISSLAMSTDGSLYVSGIYRDGTYETAIYNTYMLKDIGSGKQWYTIGQNSASIRSVVVDNFNNVYGSSYSESGSAVWKYNAQTDLWMQLGNNLNGLASRMAVSNNGSLYVINTDSPSNPQHSGVMTWNGSSWEFVGGGYIPGVIQLDSITVDDSGNLYVGGTTSDNYYSGVWKWDGNSWSQIGGAGTIGYYNCRNVFAVAVDTIGNIYAACGNIYVHKP